MLTKLTYYTNPNKIIRQAFQKWELWQKISKSSDIK